MPSTYAHYRMGQEVRRLLDDKEKNIVESYPQLFLIGLHGPDILFYYKPLFKNRINQEGYDMHKRAGKEFFKRAAIIVKRHSGNDAYLSYVYGFICHFALDVTCHGYVDEKIAASGVSHAEIEVEFDRMLMVKDGYDPIIHRTTDHIVPSVENAEVIHAFFEGVSRSQACKALEGMIFNNNLLIAPSKGKRLFINTLLTLTGNYKEMHGLMVNFEKNPRCDDSTAKLWTLYQKARELSVLLIHEYRDYLDGMEKLNSIYNYSFGTKPVAEEELEDAI